jgi:hypothetical protein
MEGEIIHISAASSNHINAMDMSKDYGDGANPVILKSEFVLSLCEQLIGGQNLGAKQKSLIDRCTAGVYRQYMQNNFHGMPPTLQDFHAELLKQAEPEAQEIALAIELFTSGSLNTFAKPTNVDVNNRLICYDILDLAKYATFEEVAHLLVHEVLPNHYELSRYKIKLISMRGLPAQLRAVLESIPTAAQPMDVLRTGCSMMGTMLPERFDHHINDARNIADRLLAIFPSMLLYWYHFARNGMRIDVKSRQQASL